MEKLSDSLLQLFMLIDDMAPAFESNPLSGGRLVSPTGIKNATDFELVYERNLKDYQKRYPGASEERFKEYWKKRLSRRIEVIEREIKDDPTVQWAEIYINDYLKAGNRNEKHASFFYALVDNGYIFGDQDVFICALNYKKLPGGAEKIKWLRKKSEAMYFQQKTKLSVKQLNDCFTSTDGKMFKENNRLTSFPENPLPEIIKKFTDTSKAC